MSAASNTKDCFREFIGQKIVGALFDALPVNRADLSRGTKTLIFEDGRGLTIASNGSFWIESADEVRRAVQSTQRDLKQKKRELTGVLELAGALDA